MKVIVDSFEGDFVVIEIDGQTQDISKNDVSLDVKAGDVVVLISCMWKTNVGATEQRAKQIKKLMDDVWED